MRKLSALWFLSVVTLTSALSGCRCDSPKTDKRWGEIGVVYEEEGVSKTGTDAVYDFGAVFMGQRQTLKLVVKNLGSGELTLSALEKDSGDAVSIGGSGEPDPVFEVQFEQKALAPSDDAQYEMTFLAPQSSEKVVDHQVKLLLRASNAKPGAETATITIKGRAVSGVCELPKVIDFGAVAKGDSYTYSQELRNPTEVEAAAFVGDIDSTTPDRLAFSFKADSARGSFTIPPNRSRTVSITFAPTELRPYLAYVKMKASAQCPEYTIKLKGEGVDSVLTWDPPKVKFGYVSPGATATAELTFKNAGNGPANLTGISTTVPAEFAVVAEAGQDATKLTVPGKGGTAKLVLSFKAPSAVVGPRFGDLRFNTNLTKPATGAVKLEGYAGGPDIQVNPAPVLNFGKVAYFAGAGSYQTRKLSVMNVGTRPSPPDPKGNLLLGKGGAGQPYFEVKPLNADSSLSEIEIPIPATSGKNSYNPAVGLEASAGKNLVDLIVKITPASVALKKYEVTLFSNDSDEPEVKVVVTADVVEMPPCNYEVKPTALNYGLVTPPQYKDLSFTIKNLGQNQGDICLLSNLDLAVGSDAIFSLPAGPVPSKELLPNESYTVQVRAWPKGPATSTIANVSGNVELFMSSPTQPQKLVKLDASVALGCLTIAPSDLDFGTVKKGCSSAKRTFSVYNTCTTAVTLNSVVMQSAAGQPVGGPDCPTATSGYTFCPEFMLVGNPLTAPTSLSPGAAPFTFDAKYGPIDMGTDSGVLALSATHSGQNVTYIVTLQGKGDTVGLNTDVFVQDASPKADILLVIDNSCSMYEEQTSLATNFASFIKYAKSSGVDYHIGVITTDMDSSIDKGRLRGDATNPKVLTSTTPDVENKFKAKVNLGTMGSGWEKGFEPSLAALTAPLVTNENAGFLRNDASLAIVVVTDETEQSAQQPPYYFNQFMNIKGVKRANLFTFNAIAGFVSPVPAGCSYFLDDSKYANMVSMTGGVKENICTPDWAKALEALGKTAFGFRTNFFLAGNPELTGGKTITVEIDGVSQPATDPRGGTVWSYDPVANSVNFEPMFVPEPGQTLTITYFVTCFP